MIKAIIFDLDNTLVDFMLLKRAAVNAAIYAMIDAGLKLSHAETLDMINKIYESEGIEYQQVFDNLLHEALGKVDYKIMSAGIVAYRKAREAALKPYPGVLPTLIELIKMGLKLAVVSDAPSKEAWLRLSYINFQHLFDVVITYDETRERKPSPVPFNLALQELGLKANECLMIGDWAERDMVGAKAVGMKTVFARYGDTFDTVNPESDYDINSISELIEIIKKENSDI
ncbi:MAG TPA: TIGR02253 family HAD-type hydrolase [Ignavibacteria bacterium]|nr:TIGR02253 family HAD-type hydrolase [Ignavibacteria bacterium]HQY51748.1 TIGR02253 family HAD-type hydrolase [Ignavibacteria bacterium]HRA99389.1 TIGR02253 family HAD-type hydrolase [Ignavibacteria bacterium]